MKEPVFFWLHIKKCGGTSFRKTYTPPYIQTDRIGNYKSFEDLPPEEWNDALNNYRVELGDHDYRRMLYAKEFLYSDDIFKRMFKFTIVRNPYDRIISAWKYFYGNGWAKYRRIRKQPSNLIRKFSFEYFLHSLPGIWESRSDREIATHSAPIWPDITGKEGEALLDRIYKLEQMHEMIEELNDKFDLNVAQLDRDNINRHSTTYRRYYNVRTRQLVEKYYGDDILQLDYEF